MCLYVLSVLHISRRPPQFYLLAFSHTEVLELVDSHLPIAVAHQDAVCPFGKQQGRHLHKGCGMVHNDWVQAKGEERFVFSGHRIMFQVR